MDDKERWENIGIRDLRFLTVDIINNFNISLSGTDLLLLLISLSCELHARTRVMEDHESDLLLWFLSKEVVTLWRGLERARGV